jgi:hypothetical protein
MIKIVYQGRCGYMNIDTNEVEFNMQRFKNILVAIDYFKRLEIEEKILKNFLDNLG